MKTFLPAFFCCLSVIFCNPQTSVAGNPSNLFDMHQFRATLYTNNGTIADGNAVAFDELFNNEIDANDAHKVMNFGENFGIMRHAELLSVEARSPLQIADTIFYNLQNLRQQDYQLKFVPVNLVSTGLTAYLYDRYLNTNTFISLSNENYINFTITAEPGSSAADRFLVIFSKGRLAEINFISLSATWNADKNVDLKWRVGNERDVDEYTVERSNNGQDFTAIGTKNPLGNNGSTESYDSKDMNANRNGNYYRISAKDQYGQVKYSSVVNSGMLEDGAVTIYPNPVKDGIMNIHFSNQATGTYKLQLTNKMGQVVYATTTDITSVNQVKVITLDKKITMGTYQLSIISVSGNKITRQVMIR